MPGDGNRKSPYKLSLDGHHAGALRVTGFSKTNASGGSEEKDRIAQEAKDSLRR